MQTKVTQTHKQKQLLFWARSGQSRPIWATKWVLGKLEKLAHKQNQPIKGKRTTKSGGLTFGVWNQEGEEDGVDRREQVTAEKSWAMAPAELRPSLWTGPACSFTPQFTEVYWMFTNKRHWDYGHKKDSVGSRLQKPASHTEEDWGQWLTTGIYANNSVRLQWRWKLPITQRHHGVIANIIQVCGNPQNCQPIKAQPQ